MKMLKGVLATFLMCAILAGNVGWMKANPSETTEISTNIGEYKTLENPLPIRE